MANTIKKEDIIEKTDSTSEVAKVEEVKTEPTVEQDPLKAELERVQKNKTGGRTELEKASFSLKKNADRVKELGGDPSAVLGTETTETDDDKPVTMGMLKKIQQDTAAKTALQMADEVQDETERELLKYHLENTIRSTGNPAEDFKLAQNQVYAVKNAQIIEEIQRKKQPASHSNSTSAPAKNDIVDGELTPQEQLFMKKPFNLTKEQIIKARQK